MRVCGWRIQASASWLTVVGRRRAGLAECRLRLGSARVDVHCQLNTASCETGHPWTRWAAAAGCVRCVWCVVCGLRFVVCGVWMMCVWVDLCPAQTLWAPDIENAARPDQGSRAGSQRGAE